MRLPNSSTSPGGVKTDPDSGKHSIDGGAEVAFYHRKSADLAISAADGGQQALTAVFADKFSKGANKVRSEAPVV